MNRNRTLAILTSTIAFTAALLSFSTASMGQQAPTTPVAVQADTANAADKAALEALNRDWLNAYKTRDKATLDRILADDFAAVYPDNRLLRKADLLAAATGTGRVIHTIGWDNLRIMVFGDIAVVTARSTLSGTSAGKAFTSSNEYADVYARRSGRWQAISAHVARAVPAS